MSERDVDEAAPQLVRARQAFSTYLRVDSRGAPLEINTERVFSADDPIVLAHPDSFEPVDLALMQGRDR